MLSLNLPSTVSIKAVTYGTPRVGNDVYAHFFDSKVSNFVRINNDDDMVPIVPGRGLGFMHPKVEQIPLQLLGLCTYATSLRAGRDSFPHGYICCILPWQ
jgi:hypothetical protein